jgi:hypothetical protein
MVGMTYFICNKVIETLGSDRWDVAPEYGDCCGGIAVCTFVRMEVKWMEGQCVSEVT